MASETFQTELIRKLVDAQLALRAEILRQVLRKANFNPDQPRVPAGDPDGGKWTDGGGGFGDAGESARVYRVNDEFGQYYVDLGALEGYRGAHTISSHVLPSKAELLVAMGSEASRWLPISGAERRQGKFGSYPDALRYVNETLQASIETVEAVKAWLKGGDEGELITKYYGRPTGAEWYRDSAYSKPRWRTTYSVGVILRYDPRLPQGFLVVTAYPRNEDWEEKLMRQYVAKSPGFRAFTRAMIQDHKMFDSQAELINFGISHVLHQFPETADDLESFLDRWLEPEVSDQQLEDLWAASSADFFLVGDSVRPFLTRVLQRLQERRGQNSAS